MFIEFSKKNSRKIEQAYCSCSLCSIADAVYAMAHALHNTINENCTNPELSKCNSDQSAPSGAELLKAIRNLSFSGMQGTQVIQIQSHGKEINEKKRENWKIILP